MKGQVRRRFLAFVLTIALCIEPGWWGLSGIINVWGSGQAVFEQDTPYIENDSLSGGGWEERSLSGDGVSWNGVSENNISGNEILEIEVSENSVDTVSKDTVSQDSTSNNGNLSGEVSADYLSGNELQNNAISENKELENQVAVSQGSIKSTAVVFKVTFDTKKGSAVKEQMVSKGAKVKKPAAPTRSKYIFSGWYRGIKKYDFTAPVTQNLKLTAKWTKVSVGKSKIKKLSNPSSGVLEVKLQKVKGAKGYQIQVSTDKTFKTKKESYNVTGTTARIDGRQKGKTYYVRLRAYKLDSKGAEVYGGFNGRKYLKIKKGIKKVEPSAGAGVIKSVVLTSKKTVQIKARVSDYVKSADSYYYLFHLSCSAGKVAEGATPDAKIKKTESITMKTSLDYNTSDSKLQSKFVLAVKTVMKRLNSVTLILPGGLKRRRYQ